MKTAAIIVTYNRKELLLRCIKAIVTQSKLPDAIFIIDNASTDGTEDLLRSKEIINKESIYDGVYLEYHNTTTNGGGSLGFYFGLKLCYERNIFDYFWVMDDDGEPEKNCLKELLSHINLGDYLSPLVIDIDNHDQLAFGDNIKTIDYIKNKAINSDYIPNIANPFNGILYSKEYIRKVGFPRKEMFIWGDEVNYDIRARKCGFKPNIIVKAIHYHPKNRASLSPYFFFKRKVVFVDVKWKMYCRCCNAVYNYRISNNWTQIIKEFLLYNYFFIISIHNLSWILLYNKAFFNGLYGKFGGHYKYMRR